MKPIKYLTIVMATIMLMSCTQAKPTTAISEQNHEESEEHAFQKRLECLKKEMEMYGEITVPAPATLADKRMLHPTSIISIDVLNQRMAKYSIHNFLELELNNLKLMDNDDEIIHNYDQSRSRLMLKINNNTDVQYILYNVNLLKKDHVLSNQEKQEILGLINIIIDNPQQSLQILSELEYNYQNKLTRKEFVANRYM